MIFGAFLFMMSTAAVFQAPPEERALEALRTMCVANGSLRVQRISTDSVSITPNGNSGQSHYSQIDSVILERAEVSGLGAELAGGNESQEIRDCMEPHIQEIIRFILHDQSQELEFRHCPEGFSRVDGVVNVCFASGVGCDGGEIQLPRTRDFCGNHSTHDIGAVEGYRLPYGWRIVRGESSYNLPDSFSSLIPDNVLACYAHGVLPTCGGAGRPGGSSGDVIWNVHLSYSPDSSQ